MSLLSSFSILFETDASNASDEIDDLATSLDDIESSSTGAASGLDDVADTADTGSMAMGGLTRAVLGLAAAYVTFDTIADGVFSNALAIDEIGKFSETIGANIVEVDAWGEAAARSGGSAQAFRASIDGVSSKLADLKVTGGGELKNMFDAMGISALDASGNLKSAFDVLPEISDQFQKMSSSESFSIGRKMGLDQGTILLLQQGREAVDDLVQRQKMLGGVTKEGYEIAAVFNDQWDDTKRTFNGLWMSANTTILPALTSVLKLLESGVIWVRENQDLVEGFFLGVGGAILYMYLPAIAAAAVATTVAIAPYLAIAAAVAAVGVAVALVYEDFQKWSNGAPSLIGKILGPFEEWKDKMIAFIDEVTKKWEDFTGFLTKTGESLGSVLFDIFGDTPENITQKQNATEKAQNMLNGYNASSLNGAGLGFYQNRTSTVQNNNNVTVGGTTVNANGMTAEQASRVVNDSLTGQIEGAMGQYDTGVDR